MRRIEAGRGISDNSGMGAFVWTAVLLAVFLIMASQAFPFYSVKTREAREDELKFALKNYKNAILKHRRIYGSGPQSLADLLKPPPNPRLIRRLYDDPFFTGEVEVKNKANGIVSIKSASGEILNVKSSSVQKSLGGVEYARWYFDDGLRFKIDE